MFILMAKVFGECGCWCLGLQLRPICSSGVAQWLLPRPGQQAENVHRQGEEDRFHCAATFSLSIYLLLQI